MKGVAAPEIGWLDVAPTPAADGDPLLGHLEAPTGVFQWHLDAFDLPEGAVHLATSAQYPNQAFRLGEAWGVQFHPEVDYEQFSIWIANHPGAAAACGLDEEAIRERRQARRGRAGLPCVPDGALRRLSRASGLDVASRPRRAAYALVAADEDARCCRASSSCGGGMCGVPPIRSTNQFSNRPSRLVS